MTLRFATGALPLAFAIWAAVAAFIAVYLLHVLLDRRNGKDDS